MTRETIYVVQAFNAGKGKSLRADVPIPCRSAETARRTAERLAPAKAGVVAFSTAGRRRTGRLRRRTHHHLQDGTVAGTFRGYMSSADFAAVKALS
jgi:hypothetical protein